MSEIYQNDFDGLERRSPRPITHFCKDYNGLLRIHRDSWRNIVKLLPIIVFQEWDVNCFNKWSNNG